MELRQLRCLVVCAQTQSFSKAASILFTSQSNVSKTIASLEKEMGRKLFERKQHGIALTEKGKIVYHYALSMLDCSEKIMDCMEEEEAEDLRISFQPSSWFASAFCDYYIRFGGDGRRFHIMSAPVDEIIRRISNDLDQLGFAYIEDSQLKKLEEIFRKNHIGYYALKRTRTVLYYGGKTERKDRADSECAQKEYPFEESQDGQNDIGEQQDRQKRIQEKPEGIEEKQGRIEKKQDNMEEKQESGGSIELPLIQGCEDFYSGISSWKDRSINREGRRKPRVVITTNSDYVMQEILQKTELSNISPEYLSHREKSLRHDTMRLEENEQTVWFICMFRNDRVLESLPKQFLSFIKNYIADR